MTELLTREFQVREFDEEARTIRGLALPFGTVANVDGIQERFERGAFGEVADAHLYYGHGHLNGKAPIGLITRAEETDDGLEIEARISQTADGNDTYTLLRDGVLKNLSIGFSPVQQRMEDGVVVRTKATLREVSIVPIPAYAGASISEVRTAEDTKTKEVQQEPIMENENTYAPVSDLVEVRESLEDLERRFNVMGTESKGSDPLMKYRSFGEFVKGLADGSSRGDAELITRAFTGATTTDSNAQPAWVSRQIKLVEENRAILNLFNKAPLPSTGLSVNYPVFSSKSGDVAAQVAEGDDLAYLELVVDDATAPVKTYGGYSSLSRQAIERSDVPYLQRVLDMQTISYAKVTNGVVRTALTGGSGYNTNTGLTAANTTAAGWLSAAIDGVTQINANSRGLKADVWIMSIAAFAKLAAVVDSAGRPVFVINGDGVNSLGNASVTGLTANVAGIPVYVDASLTGTFSYIVSTEAITVMESPGAPFRLQDENVVNLTKDFSLYGYLATTLDDAKGVVKVTTT